MAIWRTLWAPTDVVSLSLVEEVINMLHSDSYAGFILQRDFNVSWSPENLCPLKSTLNGLVNSWIKLSIKLLCHPTIF